jgi:hypothetical protein
MSDTVDEAQQRFKEPAQPMSEYEREQQRIRANYERLKAERLTREASQNPSQA